MSERVVALPEYSVASMQIADEHAAQRAVVDVQTALEWARNNGVDLSRSSSRVASINAAREAMGLPKFHIQAAVLSRAGMVNSDETPDIKRPVKPFEMASIAPVAARPRQLPVLPPAEEKRMPAPHPHEQPTAEVETTASPRAHITRTSAGLRDVLFAEMEALRAGTSSPRQAMAVAKLASTIVESVKMEMEFIRLNPTVEGLPAPLQLVKP